MRLDVVDRHRAVPEKDTSLNDAPGSPRPDAVHDGRKTDEK